MYVYIYIYRYVTYPSIHPSIHPSIVCFTHTRDFAWGWCSSGAHGSCFDASCSCSANFTRCAKRLEMKTSLGDLWVGSVWVSFSGMNSDHLSGMNSQHLSGMSSDHLSGMNSDHVAGMNSDHMSGMNSDRLSGMNSDICQE